MPEDRQERRIVNSRSRWDTLRFWLVAAVALAAIAGLMTTAAQEGNEPVPKELDNEEGAWIEEAPVEDDGANLEAMGRIITIPAGAFTSDGFDPDGYFKSFAGGYFVGTVASGACLVAPVNFPRGATRIVKVEVFARDDNRDDSEWFSLYRIRLGTCSAQRIGQVTTVGSACRAYNMPVTNRAIANGYAYQITTCARQSIYVYGVKIQYR
jgi:hypothetical protein